MTTPVVVTVWPATADAGVVLLVTVWICAIVLTVGVEFGWVLGVGTTGAKSSKLLIVFACVALRAMEVVLLGAAAGAPVPALPLPYATRSMTLSSSLHVLEQPPRATLELTRATLPAVALRSIEPVTSGAGSGVPTLPPEAPEIRNVPPAGIAGVSAGIGVRPVQVAPVADLYWIDHPLTSTGAPLTLNSSTKSLRFVAPLSVSYTHLTLPTNREV